MSAVIEAIIFQFELRYKNCMKKLLDTGNLCAKVQKFAVTPQVWLSIFGYLGPQFHTNQFYYKFQII
jgi:hypothetical protein